MKSLRVTKLLLLSAVQALLVWPNAHAATVSSPRDTVDILAANEYQKVTDLDVWGAVGQTPFNLTRYSSSRTVNGTGVFGLGHNFRHSFQYELATTKADDTGRARVIVYYPNGGETTFTQIDPVLWRGTSSVSDVLKTTTDGLALVSADGSRALFTANSVAAVTTYVLTAMEDAFGLRTTLAYNTANQLAQVTEPAGRTLTFAYTSRSINAVDFKNLATVTTVPAVGQWLDLPVTSTAGYRYVRLLSADLSFAHVAEIEFYEAGTGARLSGAVISSESPALAAQALDGSPSTAFVSAAQSGAFVGYDLGDAKKIGSVRVLVQAGFEATALPTLKNALSLRVQGANEKPKTVTCLTSVTASDGRSVSYTYADFADATVPYRWPVLASVAYVDGTQATYTYGQTFASQRPLVVEYDLPHYDLSQSHGRTVYQDDLSGASALGMVDKTVNAETGATLLQVGLHNGSATTPEATYSNGSKEWTTYKNGLMTQDTDRLGKTTKYEYDANGFVVKKTDAINRVTTYLNDDQGRVLKTTYPDGTVNTLKYDDLGLPLVYTDTLGRQTTITRDSRHRILAVAYPDSTGESFSYNELNQPVVLIHRDGSIETRSYDARGLLLTKTDAIGAITRYTYDGSDRIVSRSDALGRVTAFTYNPRGQITAVTYPDGSVVGRAYDRNGNSVSATDELGAVTTYAYDQFKRLITKTDALGRTTEVIYPLDDLAKAPIAVVLPSGRSVVYGYDLAWNELTKTVAPGTAEAATTQTAYDLVQRPIALTDPLGHTTSQTYDLSDYIDSQTDALGRVSTSVYDAAGRLTSQRRADGVTTTYAYDAADRVVLTTDALGQATAQTYDAAGRLTVLTDPKGNRTTWSYDSAGHLTRKTYADGSAETYAYDLLGRRVSLTTPAGVTSSFTYDNRDRLVATTWSDATPASARSYDAVGRLSSLITSGVSTHSYAYDAAGQLLREVTAPAALAPASFTVGYAYDLDGRRCQLTYPDASVVTYDYTARGQLSALLADGPPALATFSYDQAGRRTQKVLENGTTTTYSYDLADQLLNLVHRDPLQTELARFAYSYDLAGRRTDKTITGTATQARAETYGYDAIDQVLSANYGASGIETFAYDPMGNRLRSEAQGSGLTAPSSLTTYTSNSLNQYTAISSKLSAPSSVPTYDASGNTLSIELPAPSSLLSAQSFRLQAQYDGQSRLVVAQTVDLGGEATHQAAFVYDGHNRQVSRTLDGKTTFFIWDNWSLLAEYQVSAGTPVQVARYVHGPRLDEIILQQTATQSTPVYLHEDALGGTYLLTDASGAVVERYSYTAYGEVSAFNAAGASVAKPATRFLYTGREWIAELGLNDHRNRFYLPSFGRWLNRDPIGEDGGGNLYCYTRGNPVNEIDALGFLGVGYTAAASVEGGMGNLLSAGGTVATGHGLFLSTNNGKISPGFFSAAGAFGTIMGGAAPAPSGQMPSTTVQYPSGGGGSGLAPAAFGASAGVGEGIFLTNAQNVAGLSGAFNQANINLPIGSISLGWSNGTFMLSILLGPSVGASASVYPTNTFAVAPSCR